MSKQEILSKSLELRTALQILITIREEQEAKADPAALDLSNLRQARGNLNAAITWLRK